MVKVIPFDELPCTDLIVDGVYEGGTSGQLRDEPMPQLFNGIGNRGGFRASGRGENKKFIVLYTSGENKDWPDHLDQYTGQFIYYGDNRRPGHEIHDTRPGGNRILRHVYNLMHTNPPDRTRVPPFFIFQKSPTPNSARSVQFRGLAAPGFPGLTGFTDLVAVWKSSEGQRFQNYRATFTVLDAGTIPRSWLRDLEQGNSLTQNAPKAWSEWVRSGRYQVLTAEATTTIRSQTEQLPDSPTKTSILSMLWQHFDGHPNIFEAFAARIFKMHDQRVIIDEITRPSGDGGRDALGRYLLGLSEDPVYVDFSLEAKCYRPGIEGMSAVNVSVRDVSRLISRIRNRQFGVLVTTSAIGRQAYEEVRQDRHPILFISGKDIVDILVDNGINTPELVGRFLRSEFGLPPLSGPR